MSLLVFLLAATLAPSQAPDETAPAPAPTVSAGTAAPAIDSGLQAFRKKRFREAEIAFRRAVEAEPSNAAAHFYLGYTYYKMGEPTRRLNPDKQKAVQEFNRAFELDPQFRPVWGTGKK
jgi:Flp pilus assembly protein TadD